MGGHRTRSHLSSLVVLAVFVAGVASCGSTEPAAEPTTAPSAEATPGAGAERSPRLALWLANKDELLARSDAVYDLVMSAWFDEAEAYKIRSRDASTVVLGGLTETWVSKDPGWLEFLVTVANGGDPNGPLQITDDMYLMLGSDGDGTLDRRCNPPGWDNIEAMDPRDSEWRKLILAFYENVAWTPQHDGVIVDMVDAYPFCDGGWSGGVSTPIDASAWVSAQDQILSLFRSKIPADKWLIANAGHDFPEGSPFPEHLNGYLLENFLGGWGATLEEGLASAERALRTTQAPHVVVFAVDTDDTGTIDWARFRTGLAASLLLDNTYFAFDYGPRDHGGVTDWWFPQYYDVALGDPVAGYSLSGGAYRRDFEKGVVVVAAGADAHLAFDAPYVDVATGRTASSFDVPKGDAGIFVLPEGLSA